jgi:hypothetical protein
MKKLLQNAWVSWKTSSAGILASLPQLELAYKAHDWRALLCGVATIVLGLLARDGDKSSEDTGAKS